MQTRGHCAALLRKAVAYRSSALGAQAHGPCALPTPRHSGLHTSPQCSSAWAAAIQVAAKMAGNVVKHANDGMTIDPLRTVAKEMQLLTGDMRKLLTSAHPSLDRVAKYYLQSQGKHVRPLIVLLMSRATHVCPKNSQHNALHSASAIDTSISPVQILADANPSVLCQSIKDPEPGNARSEILPAQRRLAEITELIHTASLLHDDVIDRSESRRGSASANFEFGSKMAVLAGDFMLARASVALARLRHLEVVELMSTVIANLVEGEFMQLKNTARDEPSPEWSEETLAYYIHKTYLKTASLLSKSCRASALLGNVDGPTVEAAYGFGRNIGLAFQLVDDMLDYTQSGHHLGKPAGADLKLGLATAPLLFAWKQKPELGALVGRKFAVEGDVERAYDLVLQSDGIEQTRALARDYAAKAVAAISGFPDSEAKDGLVEMARRTAERQK